MEEAYLLVFWIEIALFVCLFVVSLIPWKRKKTYLMYLSFLFVFALFQPLTAARSEFVLIGHDLVSDSMIEMAGNIVSSLTALIALVLTISLVAIQHSAQFYTHRLIDTFRKRGDTYFILAASVGALIMGFFVPAMSNAWQRFYIASSIYLLLVLIPFFIRIVESLSLDSTISEIVLRSRKPSETKDSLRILFDIAHRYIQSSDLDSLRKIHEGIEEVIRIAIKERRYPDELRTELISNLFGGIKRHTRHMLERNDREMTLLVCNHLKTLGSLGSISDNNLLLDNVYDRLSGMSRDIELYKKYLSDKHFYLRDIAVTTSDMIELLISDKAELSILKKWAKLLSKKLPPIVKREDGARLTSMSNMAIRCVKVLCDIDRSLIVSKDKKFGFSIEAIHKYFTDVGSTAKTRIIELFRALLESSLDIDSGASGIKILESLVKSTKNHSDYLQIVLASYIVMYSEKCSESNLSEVLVLHRDSLDSWVGDNADEKSLRNHFLELKEKLKSMSTFEFGWMVMQSFREFKVLCEDKRQDYYERQHWDLLCNELSELIRVIHSQNTEE